jgi:hypothetical protein
MQQDSSPARNGTNIFARALLKRAEITEEYFVDQEISENSSTRRGERPAGRIELELPYDGHEWFTRDARNDVALGLAAHPESDGTAVIGHLLLRNYAKTSLRDSLRLGSQNSSIPIEVPVSAGPGDGDQFAHLSADRQTCITRYEFDPGAPDLIPSRLEIELLDPDSFALPPFPLRSEDGRTAGDVIEHALPTAAGRRYIASILANIKKQASFREGLTLFIVVQLTLPVEEGDARDLRPAVTRVAINWPTITFLRTMQLHVIVEDGKAGSAGDGRLEERTVRYNPVDRCIEWDNVPMTPVPSTTGGTKVRQFKSAPMLLSIRQPAALYAQQNLYARAEIQIPEYLLSGLDARVYDATGYIRQKPPVTLTTKVSATAALILDDAFARREFSPNQHLFFDEIVPGKERVTDIMTALRDRGFDVRQAWPEGSQPFYDEKMATWSWLLVAHRQEGPDDMVLWILVEGRTFGTERRTVLPGGEVRFLTSLPSGELRLFIRGTLARDSNELTREINALQSRLREQFGRVRQRR